jgi:hypothetical protein
MQTKRCWTASVAAVALAALTGGAVQAADEPFGDFISPLSNPTNFEDPRATTEVRPIYLYHDISDDFVTNGGHAQLFAAQLRIALSDRWALIATKDGYIWMSPESVVPHGNGWANLAVGVKYTFYRDPERRAMATVGFRYEIASGNHDVLQGYGDGTINGFVSALWGWRDPHLMGYTGPRIAASNKDTTFYDLSLHADYKIGPLYPLIEMNWVYEMASGQRLPIDQEGFDLFNLGAADVAGNSVVTMAFGARLRMLSGIDLMGGYRGNVDIGAAYELPVTSREDIFGWRVTSDVIYSVF